MEWKKGRKRRLHLSKGKQSNLKKGKRGSEWHTRVRNVVGEREAEAVVGSGMEGTPDARKSSIERQLQMQGEYSTEKTADPRSAMHGG